MDAAYLHSETNGGPRNDLVPGSAVSVVTNNSAPIEDSEDWLDDGDVDLAALITPCR
jgi:hypothetical protein